MAARKEISDFIMLERTATPPTLDEIDAHLIRILEIYNERKADVLTLQNDLFELVSSCRLYERSFKAKHTKCDFEKVIIVLLQTAADWQIILPDNEVQRYEKVKLNIIDDLAKYIRSIYQRAGARTLQSVANGQQPGMTTLLPGNRQQPATNKMQYASDDEWASLLPESINTERVRESIRKAIKRGWITITPQNLKWEGVSSKGCKAQLAYFCGKVCGYRRKFHESGYSYNDGNPTRYQAFEKLFGVTRLDRALTQVLEAKQPQAWRERIDRLFE